MKIFQTSAHPPHFKVLEYDGDIERVWETVPVRAPSFTLPVTRYAASHAAIDARVWLKQQRCWILFHADSSRK